MGKLNGLDLFSGIGGITLGLSSWVIPIAYCESDRYAQAVLLSRMSEGKLPIAPIWDDVRTLQGDMLPRPIDIIYGGFPCQDISIAGLGAGLEGQRSGLFYEIARLAKEIRPTFIFLENVPAINSRGLHSVGDTLAQLRYDCRWCTISAAEVGAEFRGDRWFLLAKACSEGLQGLYQKSGRVNMQSASSSFQRQVARIGEADPDILRKGHGIYYGLDAIKSLGNAVVPAQVAEAFSRLIGISDWTK